MFLLINLLACTTCLAEQLPRPGPSDARILLATYRDSEIYKVVASYGFQTTIEFSSQETIETISIGDSIGWQVVPAGHRVFLKPQELNALTNMTVVTSMRPYYFELGAKKSRDPQSVTFLIRFTYPDDGPTGVGVAVGSKAPALPAKKPTDYNFNYTLTGSHDIAPTRVFDDGEFTYMQFRSMTDLPAIFLVDKEKQESVVNYRIEGPYVVIERTGAQFSLRHGGEITCVHNKSVPPSSSSTTKTSLSSAPIAEASSQ
jgi:type IV secretion system protein VirB9